MSTFDDSYAKEKFCQAVEALIGTLPIHERLRFALSPLLDLRASSRTAQHLPPDLELQFHRLMKKLTGKPLELSEEQATALAKEILSMFVDVMGGL